MHIQFLVWCLSYHNSQILKSNTTHSTDKSSDLCWWPSFTYAHGSRTTTGAANDSGFQKQAFFSAWRKSYREEKKGERDKGSKRQVGRRREWEGAGIFHPYSPADMASQRNLSLDPQNSQLSPSNAVNLAVILHWLAFCSFIWGDFSSHDFHTGGLAKEVHVREKPQKSSDLIHQLSDLRSAWLTCAHLNPPEQGKKKSA